MLTVSTDGLQDLVSNALERMAFVFVEPCGTTAGEMIACAAAHSSIELRGAKNYVVTVTATPGFVQEVAAGMMGCDESEIDVDDHGSATVSELANIFGGELVMMMANEDEGMLIGLPRDVTDEDAGGAADRAGDGGRVCMVGTESGELMVSVSPD